MEVLLTLISQIWHVFCSLTYVYPHSETSETLNPKGKARNKLFAIAQETIVSTQEGRTL